MTTTPAPVEIAAAGSFRLRDHIHRAKPCRRLAVFERQILAHNAHIFQPIGRNRHLPGDENQIAAHHIRHITRNRSGRGGQYDVQFLEARIDLSGHDVLRIEGKV